MIALENSKFRWQKLMLAFFVITVALSATSCGQKSDSSSSSNPKEAAAQLAEETQSTPDLTESPMAAPGRFSIEARRGGGENSESIAVSNGELIIDETGQSGTWEVDFNRLGFSPAESHSGRIVIEFLRPDDPHIVLRMHPMVFDDDVLFFFPDGIAPAGPSIGHWEYRTDAGIEAKGEIELSPIAQEGN